MSWTNRAQGGTGASSGPQAYAAPQAQPFINQQNMYPNYPGGTGNAPQQAPQQSQYWQAPTPGPPPQQPPQLQYNQQYAQVYQQDYPPNANQHYQQPQQYNHNYTNPGYANPQQNYQQNYYQNQPAQQNYPQNTSNNDGWEDNWDWGWEESGKQAQKAQNAQRQPMQQEQLFNNANNANVLEESFAPANTWNWAMDDKKGSNEPVALPPKLETNVADTLPPNPLENNASPEPNIHSGNNSASSPAEEVRTLSDRDVVKERMPNLALGKRFHLDNLTPQWSIESQMSQESSDGPQTHSESTYRSENQSRNSNSPGPITDNSNFNYSQSRLDEDYTQNSERSRQLDEPTLADSIQTGSRRESQDELSYTMQDLTLANHEKLAAENVLVNQTVESRNPQQNLSNMQPPPAISPASLPASASGGHPVFSSMSMPPPPPVSSAAMPPPISEAPPVQPPSGNLAQTPTPPPSAQVGPAPPSNVAQPPPPATSASLPPTNFPPPSNLQNPFKHAGPFAHKPKTSSSSASAQPFPSQLSGADLTSPAVVNKASKQSRSSGGFEANLETTPDNSERPDHPQMSTFRPPPAPQPVPVPDNLEVAPRSDRNEYLQTAHLSSGDYGENTDFTRGMPPPGLRRMVLGQQEPEYGPGARAAPDEPPPGLARMVPGQQTEGDDGYGQPADYAERLIDGRPARAYRRPVGRDSDAYPQYDRRVVPGLEREHVDGSDYSAPPDDTQREGTMEGENLQDLSAVSSADLSYSREPPPPGAEPEPARASSGRRSSADTDRERPFDASPRRRRTSRDRDRDRDRYSRPDNKYDRDDGKPARDDRRPDKERRERRDRERRDRDESPDARRKRRSARSHRYETEDTDYYSDKERDRRRHREGSHAARPPRDSRRYEPRAYRDIDPARTHGGRRRERGDDERRRERGDDERRRERGDDERRRERGDDERRRVTFSREAKANDSSRSEGEYSPASASRAGTATDEEAPAPRRRARHGSRRAPDPYYDMYGGAVYGDPYSAQRQQYEYYERLRRADPAAYLQVYTRLMASHADRKPHELAAGYELGAPGALGHEPRAGLHSGRSSATGLKGNDTYYMCGRDSSQRDAPSRRTDHSDRDLGTEASLPLHLDSSTVRSDRMTPPRFSTAHVKGSISSRHVVVVQPSWPVDGRPATVQLLALPALLAADPAAAELQRSPGPLVKGVTHKKSVISYCQARVRAAAREAGAGGGAGGERGERGPGDVLGYVLLWELLALLLRQNGVVVGSDIAELLVKNTRDYEYDTAAGGAAHDGSRRTSSPAGAEEAPPDAAPSTPSAAPDAARGESAGADGADSGDGGDGAGDADEAAALDKFREYLMYGNRQEALEWAMSRSLWAHALALAAHCDRRTRGAAAARFLQATPRCDPLHTLYAALQAARPPAATCVADPRWGDWRPHVAILLANGGAQPDLDTSTLTMLGDSLASRGLIYSAQFCYLTGGVPFARHPLAPLPPPGAAPGGAAPRLSLLLADPRAASLAQLATNRAILATEIYEYALSLNQDYVIPDLQVYKLVVASRLVDGGQYERALSYTEQAARAVARAPPLYAPRLRAGLAELAARLRHLDPALAAGAGAAAPRWLDDLPAEASPQHVASDYYAQQQQQQQQYSWDQAHQYQQQQEQQQQQPPPQPYVEPEETPDYAAQYYQQLPPPDAPLVAPLAPPLAEPLAELPAAPPAAHDAPQYAYEDWNRTEEHHAQTYADSAYWHGDRGYGYGETEAAEGARPAISMPGGPAYADYDDDAPAAEQQAEGESDAAKPKEAAQKESRGGGGGGGSGGGSGGGGWLGGILTKLSLRPPNQMILPDDKNPSIVWDADKKRWKNLDGDEAEGERPPPPPPRAAPPAPSLNNSSSSQPASPVSNIFKMQKGRHIKKSYVDVFNPSGAAPRPLPPAAAVLGPPPALAPHPTYFVPAATVHVSIPASPSSTPPPAPIPDATPKESGAYEPAQAQAADDQLRSGI